MRWTSMKNQKNSEYYLYFPVFFVDVRSSMSDNGMVVPFILN